jgi:hypothetical protein
MTNSNEADAPDPLDFDLPEGVQPGSEADPLFGLIDLDEPPAEVWTEIHFEAEAEAEQEIEDPEAEIG